MTEQERNIREHERREDAYAQEDSWMDSRDAGEDMSRPDDIRRGGS